MSTKCGVIYSVHSSSVFVCRSVHILVQTTSPKPMNQTQNNFIGIFLSKLFKELFPCRTFVNAASERGKSAKTLKIFLSKSTGLIHKLFCTNFPWVTLCQDWKLWKSSWSKVLAWFKNNWAEMFFGWQKHWPDLLIFFHKWSLGDPLTKIVQIIQISWKTWQPGAVAGFPYMYTVKTLKIYEALLNQIKKTSLICIYSENFKSLLDQKS